MLTYVGIPRASVTHAVSLHGTTPRSTSLGLGAPTSPSATFGARSHEDGLQGVTDLGLARSQLLGVCTTSNTSQASTPSTTMSPFPKLVRRDLSPRRSSGKTGGIIDALQTELDETKAHLDRVKTEVRNCHREISMVRSRRRRQLSTSGRTTLTSPSSHGRARTYARRVIACVPRARLSTTSSAGKSA